MTSGHYQQPWLHDVDIAVRGNVASLSGRVGDIGEGATGLFVDDRRVVSVLAVRVDETTPIQLAHALHGDRLEVLAMVRHLGDAGPDPTVELRRARQLVDDGLHESLRLTSRAASPVAATVVVSVAADGAELASVKGGVRASAQLAIEGREHGLEWRDDRHATTLTWSTQPNRVEVIGGVAWVAFDVALGPGEAWDLEATVIATALVPTDFDARPGAKNIDWSQARVAAADHRLTELAATSFADLRGLLLSDPHDATDTFAAAGSPWYQTLFGRDSLWTARLMLPFGSELARGTLWALARRQGEVDDPSTAQEPGKILHEVRRSPFTDPSSNLDLPPIYYGTVDATPLWVTLLHEAWLWGLPQSALAGLRPHLDRAVAWIERSIVTSGGFLTYFDASGTGLSNQGWKDSGDAMRHRDGRIATGPIALVETQAYAVEATLRGADLLERGFGESGARWRSLARDLADRLRQHFWVEDEGGPYLAMALDGDGVPVDGLGSNMAHVLGTGTLTPAEEALISRRLGQPELLSPAGVRTLGSNNPAYNPIGYHTGSIWAHDSAIACLGLDRCGARALAATIATGLVGIGPQVDYRLPELYSGEQIMGQVVPYPASCRPQAWAAAAIGALVSVGLGLRADVPAGELAINPLLPLPFGAMTVDGLDVGGRRLSIEVDPQGRFTCLGGPADLTVVGALSHRW